MATTGAKFPTTAESTSAAPWSDDAWVNPNNVTAAGTVYATITAATYDAGDQSHKLRCTGFDFSAIGNSDTIDGVVVIVGGASYQAGTASIDLVQLVNAATPIGDNKRATPVAVTASDANYTQGGSTDKWNATLTPAVVKSSTFGVDVGMIANSANTDVRIDYVTIEVHYTPAPQLTLVQSGAVAMSGTTTVAGNVQWKKDLAQSGATAIAGTTSLTGDIQIAYDATPKGFVSFAALGPFGFGSASTELSLAQSGAIAVSGAMSVSGDARWDIGLVQSGSVAVAGSMSASGDAVITPAPQLTLAQSGSVALSAPLTTAGNIELALALSQTGAVSLAGASQVSGDARWNIGLVQSGAIATAGAMSTSGDAVITPAPELVISQSGAVALAGSTTVAGDARWALALAQSGAVALSATAQTAGDARWDIGLVQSGAIATAGSVSASGDVTISLAPTLVLAQSGSLTLAGTMSAAGDAAWALALTQSGQVAAAAVMGVTGDVVSSTVVDDVRLYATALPGYVRIYSTVLPGASEQGFVSFVALGPFGFGQPAAVLFELAQAGAVALTGTSALTGDAQSVIGWELEAPLEVGGISGAFSIVGDIGISLAPQLVLAQSGSVALAGAAQVSGDARWSVALSQSGAVALTGTATTAADIAVELAPTLVLSQSGSVSLAGAASVAGQARWDIGLVADPIALSGTMTAAADVTIAPAVDFALAQAGPIALAGATSVSGDAAALLEHSLQQTGAVSLAAVSALLADIAWGFEVYTPTRTSGGGGRYEPPADEDTLTRQVREAWDEVDRIRALEKRRKTGNEDDEAAMPAPVVPAAPDQAAAETSAELAEAAGDLDDEALVLLLVELA